MFYLKFLWAQFRVIPGKFITVITLPIILVTMLKMLPTLTQKISHTLLGSRTMSYVNLVCSDDELAKYLQVRVKALPLINRIEEYAIANMQSTITKTLSDLEINSIDHSGLKKMVGLKIFFDDQVSAREFDLIKNHLNRLTATIGVQMIPEHGEREIIWGPFVPAQRSQGYSAYLDWAVYGTAFIILYLVWLVNFLSVKQLLLKAVYLVERYQRRSKIYPKVIFIFLSINMLLGVQLINKRMLSGVLVGPSGELMPLIFYGAFILCTTIATLDLPRLWKKA